MSQSSYGNITLIRRDLTAILIFKRERGKGSTALVRSALAGCTHCAVVPVRSRKKRKETDTETAESDETKRRKDEISRKGSGRFG
eukprot:7064903-Prymnesium_polylepis.1